jgi:membrane protein
MNMVKAILKKILGFLRYYIVGLYEKAGENHIFLLGSGIAFSIIICMVPLTLIIFYVLGEILESATVYEQINSFIDTIIPYTKYSNRLKLILYSRVDEVIAYKNIAGYVGVVGLIFAASGLFSAMRTGLNNIFELRGPSIYVGKLRDIGMVLIVMFFIVLATALLPLAEVVRKFADDIEILRRFQLTGTQGLLYFFVSLLTIFIMFFVLYNLIPNKRVGFKTAAVGAFWAMTFWVAAKEIFGYYISSIATLKRIYGTYMLFAVLTFWLYYSSVVFLIGAQIAQLYRMKRSQGELEI